MEGIIQLLPDHLANQIAAGEVIQRPASVVKELLENAIDAGANNIQLIIRDAGKEIIQVVDDGKGMSPMDARMSFERHATSKIKKIDDLFAIRTMGFRGEALASIAAVAQVELKTKTALDEAGTQIIIEASEVISQEPVACNNGTSIAVKNLFYNVPARRKFLHTDTSEYKNIVQEFTRVAMAYPSVSFRLFNNNTEQYYLPSTNLKSRIIELLGTRFEKHLIPIQQDTDLLTIHGFIGKPDAATRTRGNQFFFINNRFIRSSYLNHAIASTFESMIDKKAFPFYVVFFEMNPERVDVNVHPSKQEVKFEDEKIIYAFLQSAIKQALAQYNIAPSIDFSIDSNLHQLESLRLPTSAQQRADAASGYISNTFKEKGKAFFLEKKDDMKQWQQQQEQLFPKLPDFPEMPIETEFDTNSSFTQSNTIPSKGNVLNFNDDNLLNQPIFQWQNYLVSTMKSGLLLVNHTRAVERITFERLFTASQQQHIVCQQLLFPSMLNIAIEDTQLVENLLPDLCEIGFDIQALGKNNFSINGLPPDVVAGTEQDLLEAIIEDVRNNVTHNKSAYKEQIIRTTVKRLRKPKNYTHEAAQVLIDELFACNQPQYTPDGQVIFKIISGEQIDNFF